MYSNICFELIKRIKVFLTYNKKENKISEYEINLVAC